MAHAPHGGAPVAWALGWRRPHGSPQCPGTPPCRGQAPRCPRHPQAPTGGPQQRPGAERGQACRGPRGALGGRGAAPPRVAAAGARTAWGAHCPTRTHMQASVVGSQVFIFFSPQQPPTQPPCPGACSKPALPGHQSAAAVTYRRHRHADTGVLCSPIVAPKQPRHLPRHLTKP
jgi:hypothetical protein